MLSIINRSTIPLLLAAFSLAANPTYLTVPSPATIAHRGVISHRISGCDYFLVATKSGYDLLEWYGGHDPDKGDYLVGGFGSYGMHDIYDETADADLRVWTEDYDLTKEDALEKLSEKCE